MSKDGNNDEMLKMMISKEVEPLKISTIRLAMLSIIKKFQDEGIYGYQIGEKLFQVTEGDMIGNQAGFYAILRRYVKQGLLKTEIRSTSSTRPTRKYYRLTEKGELVHNALYQNWIHYYDIVDRLFKSN